MRRNHLVSAVFSQIADLLEMKGAEAFKVRAYRRAARALNGLDDDVSVLESQGRLREVPGIGPALEKKTQEILATGTCRYLEELKAQVPLSLVELTRIPGIGAKTAMALFTALDVRSLDDLRARARAGALRGVPGLGEKKARAILEAVEALEHEPDPARLMGVVRPFASDLVSCLEESGCAARAALAGDLRRWTMFVSEAEIVFCPREGSVQAAASRLAWNEGLRSWCGGLETSPSESDPSGSVMDLTCALDGRIPLRIHVVPREAWYSSLLWLTGSPAHVERLRRIGVSKGLILTPLGLFDGSGRSVPVSSEREIYSALGLQYVAAELREDSGEVEAAALGRLPRLLEVSDLAGDLHVHTSFTDGVEDLDTMARSCMEMGYQYMAVTDHSKSLRVAGGLDEEGVLRQVERVKELNSRLQKGSRPFRVLSGIEVDILPDGALDLPDEVLQELDIVVASVHSAFRLGRDEMTRRLIRAVEHPLVDILGHPTGRLVGRRAGYDVDFEKLFEAAARTGTVLEINSSFDRLDLGEGPVRAANARGIRFSVSTDAHSSAGLRDIHYGASVARRAWVGKSSVVNCLPVEELLASLKRARREGKTDS